MQLRKSSTHKKSGFTLIEMMLVLFIVGILALLGLPFYQSIFQHSQDKIYAEQLMRAIQLARTMAVTQHNKMILCGSVDKNNCSREWSQGYILMSNDKKIFEFSLKKENGTLYWKAFPVYISDLQFMSNGKSNFQNGTFWYCSLKDKNPAWAIVLNQSGRARLVYPNET